MILTPKNWNDFQHYKDREPSWIKLHKSLLTNYEFVCLPVASKALAPMLWLLASEYKDGIIDASLDKLAFRLSMTRGDLADALSPLVQAGFFDSSEMLAECKQVASLEKEIQEEDIDKRKRESRARKRAERLANDAEPSGRNRSDAISLGLSPPEIENQWKRMRDWSASSQKGACLDWDARWRNWCETYLGGRNVNATGTVRANQAAGQPPTRDVAVIAGMGRALERRRKARAADEAGDDGVREEGCPGPADEPDANGDSAPGYDAASGSASLAAARHARA